MDKNQLEERHDRLSQAVDELERIRLTDRSDETKMKLKDLKKKKLFIKDQLNNIRD